MQTRATFVFTLLALSLSACAGSGSSSSSSTDGTYAAKCEVACKPPAGPCGMQDPKQCQSDCVTLTEGLTTTCAQCVIEHSGWKGVSCPSNCTSCCPCGFGPGDGTTCGGGTGCSCSAADEKCTGYAIGKTTDSACATACATK